MPSFHLPSESDLPRTQVDSPLTILNQDAAKSFLTKASKHALYGAWTRATLLSALAQNYDALETFIDGIAVEIEGKERTLEDLRAREKSAKETVNSAVELEGLREKLEELKVSSAWRRAADEETVSRAHPTSGVVLTSL